MAAAACARFRRAAGVLGQRQRLLRRGDRILLLLDVLG
jgi:hypothetical protein